MPAPPAHVWARDPALASMMPVTSRPTSAIRRLRAVHDGLLASAAAAVTATPEVAPFESRRSPLVSIHGVSASSQPLATEIGMRVMQAGGNCVDAAIAVAAALNMTEPVMTGIGGDGAVSCRILPLTSMCVSVCVRARARVRVCWWRVCRSADMPTDRGRPAAFCLYYDAASGRVRGMNASGRSPAALSIEVMERSCGRRHPSGMPRPGERGCQHTVTVPGAAAGWVDAVERWGSGMAMADILAPAIELGEGGFPVHALCAAQWRGAAPLLDAMPNGREMLTRDDDDDDEEEEEEEGGGSGGWRGPREGEVWYNRNLARTFRELATHGKEGFYSGRIAEAIVGVLAQMGGVMTADDLAKHHSTFPEP
jgi:gamma-glutamyltranspeptidase/glutathione hydrolase